MSRLAAAAFVALLAAGASAARTDDAPAARVSGRVLTAEIASDPFADGTSGAGSMVIVDKDGHTEEYSVLGTTRLTRDGKNIKFDTSLIGNLVIQAEFDPQTKTLTLLDLKSPETVAPAKKAAPPAIVSGEVAFADALKGSLSVRTGRGHTRKFAIVETTTVLRETAGGPAQEIGFETVSVGDAVEVRSRDGRTADQIRVRAAQP